MKKAIHVILFVQIMLFIPLRGISQDITIPGAITTPYPTLINLAVEWAIKGDDNMNGVVAVQFREQGAAEWHQGMNLFRVPAGKNIGFNWSNKHSGSIFDLKPDKEYEIRLTLTDPDGGSDEKVVTARTREVPVPDKNAVYIKIEPGVYDTLHTRNGTKDKHVVYDCPAGNATFTYIDLNNRKWVHIKGLHVKNLNKDGIGIQLNGASDCTVNGCFVNAVYGIVAYKPGAENCYISDNVISGTSVWTNEAMGAHGANIGEGIEMTGPGNIICYNKVTGFRDCISTMEDQHVVNQTCIDIYNNDIYTGADDGIEADFCFSNCRIFRNRLTNCFVGLSSQPGLGGPNYFIRNSMYNIIYGGYKLRRYSQGDVILHNTVIKVGSGMGGNDSMDYVYFRNNLAIGGPDGGVNWGDYGSGIPSGAAIYKPKIHCSFDYDAVGVYNVPYSAKIGTLPFSEVEKHGIEGIILEETFINVPFPDPPVPEREAQNLIPKSGSKIIDRALLIPNINDNYTGKAPDIGAYELGQELPHYGPR